MVPTAKKFSHSDAFEEGVTDPTLRLTDLLLTYSPTESPPTKNRGLTIRNRAHCGLLRNATHKVRAAAFYLNACANDTLQ